MSLLGLLFMLALAAPAGATENPGVTGAAILQVPMSARAMGMGGAFTAVGTDASALYYNPAGLSRLNAHEVGFSMFSGISGVFDNTVENFAYAGPTPFTGISGNGFTSVGANLLFAQDGNIEHNQLNPDGSLGKTENISAGSDFVGSLGYSERVGATPVEYRDTNYGINHFMGVAGKYIHSTLAGGSYSASAWAADVGYMAHAPEAGLSFGAAMLNLGGKMKFINEGDPLPLTARAGLAYQFGVPSVHNVIVAADGEYHLYEKQAFAEAGVEYFWLKSFGLRMGYQFLRDSMGLTVGFGLRWRSQLVFDYAWGMGDSLADTQRFTVSYRFGGVSPAVRARQRETSLEARPLDEQLKIDEDSNPTIDVSPAQPAPAPQQRPAQVMPGWIY